jgi:hypothetical protein
VRQNDHSIPGNVDIEFESVCSGLNGFINCEKGVFRVLAFESSMGYGVRQTCGLAVNR